MQDINDKLLVKSLFDNFGKLLVYLFYSEKDPQSFSYFKGLEKLASGTLSQTENLRLFSVNVDANPKIVNQLKVNQSSCVLLTRTDKSTIEKLHKFTPGSIVIDKIQRHLETFLQDFQSEKEVMVPQVQHLINSYPVIAFVKGTPQRPQCGFTSQFISEMKDLHVQCFYVDIIKNQKLRYWVRYVGKWPTYPQLWVKRAVIGGLDLLRQKKAKGQIQQILKTL